MGVIFAAKTSAMEVALYLSARDVTNDPRPGKRLYRSSGEWDVVDHADLHHVRR